MKALMLESRKRKSLLDPHTKMLMVLTITAVIIGGVNDGFMNIVKPALTMVPLVLFMSGNKWKSAMLYTDIYSCFYGVMSRNWAVILNALMWIIFSLGFKIKSIYNRHKLETLRNKGICYDGSVVKIIPAP